MSWYIENIEICSGTETAIIINGNSVTDTFTISQDGNKITLDSKGIFELYRLLVHKGIMEDFVNF